MLIIKVLVTKGVATNEVGGDKSSGRLKSVESKTGKLSKSWKLAKSGKKLSRSGNLLNFSAKKTGPSLLSPDAKTIFNCLWLAFIKAPILWYFDPECHIQIETDTLGYAIGGVLSQLTLRTSPDMVVTKADLAQWYQVAFFLRKMIPAETW